MLVPDVTKETIDVAKIKIEQKGLVMVTEEMYSKEVPSGDIIKQEPEVNEEVAAGSTVTVYISKGIEAGLVSVPDVTGYTEEKAKKTIDDALLKYEITTVNDSNRANGIVVSQSPEKGSVVSELDTVILVINKTDDKDEKDDNTTTKSGDDNKNPGSELNLGKRKIKLNLSNKGKREEFEVKVVLQGTLVGTRVEYEGTHSRSDGTIEITVTDAPGSYLRIYIDGELDSEEVLR